MRGVYKASISISSLSAAKTLIYITAPSTAVVEILSASVTNTDTEANEQLLVTMQRISSLGTPTATTITAAKAEAGDQAAGSTVKGNVTASEPTYGSDTEIFREGFSSLGGWFFDPMPEMRPTVAPSASLGIKMVSTPTSFTCMVKLVWREIG